MLVEDFSSATPRPPSTAHIYIIHQMLTRGMPCDHPKRTTPRKTRFKNSAFGRRRACSHAFCFLATGCVRRWWSVSCSSGVH